jgi:hypothetical protein
LWGQEVIKLLRKLHNVIKPRRVRWTAHVSRTDTRNAYSILVGILKEKYYFKDSGVDGRKIWKCTVRK